MFSVHLNYSSYIFAYILNIESLVTNISRECSIAVAVILFNKLLGKVPIFSILVNGFKLEINPRTDTSTVNCIISMLANTGRRLSLRIYICQFFFGGQVSNLFLDKL